MKIGYPCINLSINLKARTLRLATYSEEKFKEIVENNLNYLGKILEYNIANGILFLRISSDIIPFASHPVCDVDWAQYYSQELKKLGLVIKKNNIRISMHPDQFILLNSPNIKVLKNSISELQYHAKLLDSLKLNNSHKIQIHVGGVYDDKIKSLERFVLNYRKLPSKIKKRIVIENDDRLYSLADCLFINKKTGVPILFDVFHHKCHNQGESISLALKKAATTWKEKDGDPMVDYSSQKAHARKGSHAESLNPRDFLDFAKILGKKNIDVMLEIKDKEKSALKALELLRKKNKN